MDNLRWILLVSGILLIVGIFTWEVFRRRHLEWDDPGERADQDFETDGDGLFAEPVNDPPAKRRDHGAAAGSVVKRDGDLVLGDLASVKTPAPAAITVRLPERSVGGDPVNSAGAAAEPNPTDEPLICAIAVMAKPGHRFSGGSICEALEAAGLRYGPMGIFHYYGSGGQPHSQPVFSAANMLEPGSFNLADLDNLHTPGLMLFLQLPGAVDGAQAFDLMLGSGKQLAQWLGGELRDETRSSLTPQSISHMRERIIDFGRKRLLASH